MSAKYAPKGAFGQAIHTAEETVIAVILGLMTVLTFTNVVLRYVFNHSIIWGLEATLVLFAWLVIFGISYAVKVTAHLGVDAVIGALPSRGQRVLAVLSALACLIYAVLMLKGAYDYWAPFAGLNQTTGRVFPTGIDANTRDRAFYMTEQIPFPAFLSFLEDAVNQGDTYDKLPRFIPYVMLPFGMALFLLRLVQASIEIWRGERSALIVSHEAEDAIDDVRHLNKED
ncbi:TRAP transporter small permease [Albirhodobacter sp. R86504]|jgi:C4-dicarboxylate transporter DctQ subunit|uniref:TRAP transporter small permease n=1 Tax=Albirhodobacter sp. R86504 TaxID=3093848 RepID=UPI003670C40B